MPFSNSCGDTTDNAIVSNKNLSISKRFVAAFPLGPTSPLLPPHTRQKSDGVLLEYVNVYRAICKAFANASNGASPLCTYAEKYLFTNPLSSFFSLVSSNGDFSIYSRHSSSEL